MLNLNVKKMSKEAFESKKAAIEAIANEKTLYPNMPVSIALQEAEDLMVWCAPDKELLVKAGLNWKLTEDLPARIDALRYVQSIWQKEFKSLEEAQKEWKNQSPAAYDLRDELLHHFFHAYYYFPDLYSHTQQIAEGNTHADMIQDLSDLAALGKANTEPLKAVGVDLSLLDKAETTSAIMAKLLAASNGHKLQDNELRVLRDKAFTHMKEAVDEIRRCGQYVFWKDEQRYKGYISHFIKRKDQAAAKKKKKTNNNVS
jgi:hypothetical protein